MASLREQRRLVRFVYESPGVITTKEGLIDHFLCNQLFLTDRYYLPDNISPSKKMDRKRKIFTLIAACEKDTFIFPVTEERTTLDYNGIGTADDYMYLAFNPSPKAAKSTSYNFDMGYHATSRGTDLLNWLGFAKIVIEKYDKLVILLTGSVAGSILTWIITPLPKFVCMFFTNLTWCH